MKTKVVLASCLLAVASMAFGQDAVQVDPDHHQVLFENEQIRVVRMLYPPGYKTPMHGHLPGVTVILSGTTVHSWQKSGEESDTTSEPGAVSWSDGTSVHANQVTGDTALELVRVEIKKKGTTILPAPSHDAVKVDPEHNKVELENDQVRVVRAIYPEGYETPVHNHLPGISIALTDRRFRATYESGRTSSDEPISKGHVSDLGGGGEPHRTKNLGGRAEGVSIELKTRL